MKTDSTLNQKSMPAGEVDSGGCAPMPGSGFLEWNGYLPGDKAAEIWIKLHETSRSALGILDPLTKSERELYEALTAKFTFDSNMLGTMEADSQNADVEATPSRNSENENGN